MRLISWNVNGLRACVQKGFADVFNTLDADFFCIQETKMQAGQLDLAFMGYQSYWNYAEKKGYSGTAIYTRHTPLNVSYGIGIPEHDNEGRAASRNPTAPFVTISPFSASSQAPAKTPFSYAART